MKKRLLTIMLSLSMICSLMPASVHAEEMTELTMGTEALDTSEETVPLGEDDVAFLPESELADDTITEEDIVEESINEDTITEESITEETIKEKSVSEVREEAEMLQDEEEVVSGYLRYGKNNNGEYVVTGYVDGITDVVIPSYVNGIKVVGIAYEALQHCKTITSVKIPSTLEYINGYAFLGCTKLKTLTIEEGNLDYIGHMAFGSCTALANVTIGEGLKEFDSDVFYLDSGIKSISIPSTVTKIGEGTFRETSLTSVTIPASVTYIGGSAFYGNKDLYNINILGNPEYDGNPFGGTLWAEAQGDFPIMKGVLLDYAGENPVEIRIPSDVKKINDGAFMYQHTLEKVILPTGITEIGESAFWYSEKLSYINFPSTLKRIGAGAFCGTSLTSVVIPQGITEIEAQAFIQIKTLKSIQIPDSVTKIGGAAFTWCESLTSITLPKNLKEIDQEAFEESGLTSITIPDSVERIGMHAFENCKNLRTVTIGSGLKSIEKYAFCGCNNLLSVDVPNHVTSLGVYCFGYYEHDIRDYRLYSGFSMSGVNGSVANSYALTNNIPFTGRAPEGTEQPGGPDTPEIKPFGPPTITVENTGNGIKIKWNLVENGSKYVIQRRVSTRGDFETLKEVDNLTYTYLDEIPTNEWHYAYVSPGRYLTYRVQAYKGSTASGYSEPVSTYYMLQPEITSIESVSGGVKLSWKSETGAWQMEIYRKTGGGDYSLLTTVDDYNATSFIDTDVKIGTIYTYQIRGAVFDEEDNENYTSAYSDSESITVAKPQTPDPGTDPDPGTNPQPHQHFFVDVTTKATLEKDGKIETLCQCGEVRKTVPIYRPDTFTLSATSFTYNGSSQKPEVTVLDRNGNVISSSNYTVSYLNTAGEKVEPTEVGTYVVKVALKVDYSGSKSLEYMIVPKKTTIGTPAIASDGITVKWSKNTSGGGYYIYRSDDGAGYKSIKKITSNATVSWKDTTAKTNGTKYQYKIVTYKTIDGTTYKSASSSVKTIYFVSRPAISSLTNSAAKKMTVKWGKNAKATGYQLQYGLKKDFSDAKSVTVSGAATVTKAIASLTKGKTYYARMRTYKTVSGTKYYSAWSATKSVKITK